MTRKHQKLKAQSIQKEQFRLARVESVLTKLLTKVNESINELKVEELHIKSKLIELSTEQSQDDQPSTSAQAAQRLNTISLISNTDSFNVQQSKASIDMDGIENINKQMLALESLLVPLKQKAYNDIEEDEEDDDDDDDYEPTDNEESEYE